MSGGLVDAGSIPAASTNNEGHLFKVAFFIGHSHDKTVSTYCGVTTNLALSIKPALTQTV
jgi:hypothetical protein